MYGTVCLQPVSCKDLNRRIGHYAVITFFNEWVGVTQRRVLRLGEQFSVVGTLILVWSGLESFAPNEVKPDGRGGGAAVGNLQGQRRNSETRELKTDDDARLFRGGNLLSDLGYMRQVLRDKRSGSIAGAIAIKIEGFAEREAAEAVICVARQVLEVVKEYIGARLARKVIQHLAQSASGRKSPVTDETAQTEGTAYS